MKMYALGPQGTNGHEAAAIAAQWPYLAEAHGKIDIELLPTHQAVLEATEKHRCLGIVAIENDAAGFVNEVVSYWAHLPRQRAKIIGELTLPIDLSLFVHPDAFFGDIQAVTSHEKALSQCAKRIASTRLTPLTPTASTAEAARLLAARELSSKDTAILASPFAGKLYGLKLWREQMQDSSDNKTRFFVLDHKARPYQKNGEKTAIIFAVPNKPMSLSTAQTMIGCQGIDMSSMDRIRLGSKEKSVFFCEFDAHQSSRAGKDALTRLRTVVAPDSEGRPFVRVLGSWPTHDH